MRVLALDTSTECCSAALWIDGATTLRSALTERSHAELILPMIDELLTEAALEPGQLDGFAFGRGPGAFTGLRIAAGVVQGLGIATGLPIAPVSSLAAVAEQIDAAADHSILVCNDARMGEVYWAVYARRPETGVTLNGEERVTTPAGVLDRQRPGSVVGHAAGNALLRYPELRARLSDAGLQIHDGLFPRADAVARLGVAEIAAGRGVTPESALPVYVRDEVVRRPVTPV